MVLLDKAPSLTISEELFGPWETAMQWLRYYIFEGFVTYAWQKVCFKIKPSKDGRILVWFLLQIGSKKAPNLAY